MISDFFPNKIYAEIIEISEYIFFALFWVPENAQTRKRKIVDSGTRRSRVGYLAFKEERKKVLQL